MRKTLLLLSVMTCVFAAARAQNLFFAPDTVCIRQPIQLVNNDIDSNGLPATGNSYYWSFCSGFLQQDPVARNLGTGFGLARPTGYELAREGDNYYGFAINLATGNLLRYEFGDSLNSRPRVVDLGNLLNTVPDSPASLYLVRDSLNWHLFIAGGFDVATSTLARVDFGTSLAATPNSVNFGNLQGLLRGPRGVFVAKENGVWTGYVFNSQVGFSSALRLDFGANISLTPTVVPQGNPGGALFQPSDMAAIKVGSDWHFFVTNTGGTSRIVRIDLIGGLTATPSGTNLGNFNNTLFGPSGISISNDCGGYTAYITNGTSSELSRLRFTSPTGPYIHRNLGQLGVPSPFNIPSAISPIIRDSADLFAFVTNFADSTLVRLDFAGCDDATVASSTRFTPPVYRYDTPGVYNVYFAINEGQPDARTQCQQIVVLPFPDITLSNDTTICQGDTAQIFLQSITALSYNWRPDYNIVFLDTQRSAALAYPEYTVDYRITLPYANGCIVDTGVLVTVSKVFADAGPDRVLSDGASSLLGGPQTTVGPQYAYRWTPSNFLNRDDIANPLTNTPGAFTYYLTVTNESGCQDIDTVVVRVECDDINVPNAFTPGGSDYRSSRFGILNKNIVKLNYFRVYDRWGKLMFETTDITKEWDGTVDGEPARLGVYVWVADGFCTSGRRFSRNGNVTLIR